MLKVLCIIIWLYNGTTEGYYMVQTISSLREKWKNLCCGRTTFVRKQECVGIWRPNHESEKWKVVASWRNPVLNGHNPWFIIQNLLTTTVCLECLQKTSLSNNLDFLAKNQDFHIAIVVGPPSLRNFPNQNICQITVTIVIC